MFSTASVKRAFRAGAAITLALALAGCGGSQARPEVHYETVPVVVTAPCVVNRPTAPVSLKQAIPDAQWAQMPTGAKARAVEAQAGRRLNYEDRLEAATAGCR